VLDGTARVCVLACEEEDSHIDRVIVAEQIMEKDPSLLGNAERVHLQPLS
jgi:hypothetical protein